MWAFLMGLWAVQPPSSFLLFCQHLWRRAEKERGYFQCSDRAMVFLIFILTFVSRVFLSSCLAHLPLSLSFLSFWLYHQMTALPCPLLHFLMFVPFISPPAIWAILYRAFDNFPPQSSQRFASLSRVCSESPTCQNVNSAEAFSLPHLVFLGGS